MQRHTPSPCPKGKSPHISTPPEGCRMQTVRVPPPNAEHFPEKCGINAEHWRWAVLGGVWHGDCIHRSAHDALCTPMHTAHYAHKLASAARIMHTPDAQEPPDASERSEQDAPHQSRAPGAIHSAPVERSAHKERSDEMTIISESGIEECNEEVVNTISIIPATDVCIPGCGV